MNKRIRSCVRLINISKLLIAFDINERDLYAEFFMKNV